MSLHDLDGVIEAYDQALDELLKGESEPVARLYSQRDDVTLANPLGPPRLGGADVERGIEEAAANFQGGSIRFEQISKFATPDLAYVVRLEHIEVRLRGHDDPMPSSLRVTMIFRHETDGWKVSHRHADPITTPRDVSSIFASSP